MTRTGTGHGPANGTLWPLRVTTAPQPAPNRCDHRTHLRSGEPPGDFAACPVTGQAGGEENTRPGHAGLARLDLKTGRLTHLNATGKGASVLSSPGNEGRRRRHVALAGAAVFAALAVAVPVGIAWHGELTPSGLRPSAYHPTPRPHRLPTKMTGLPMPAGTNFQALVLAGNGNGKAAWYSTGSRRTKTIAGLPNEPYDFFRVPGGWLATMFMGGERCPPHCSRTMYFIADGSTRATRIGAALVASAAGHPGAVWLMSYPPTITDMATASAYVQLFSTTGSALGPRYRLPAGYRLDRGVGRYLLLNRVKPPVKPPYVSARWDPRSNRAVGRFADVIDAGPGQIAWSPDCRGCRVRLLNVLTGTSVTTPIAGGQPGELTGSFTDDGTLLAVQLTDGQLSVYDTSSGELTVIPGTALNNNYWQDFSWLNGSHTLVVAAGPGRGGATGPDQIAYWQPGDSQLRIASGTNQREVGAFASH